MKKVLEIILKKKLRKILYIIAILSHFSLSDNMLRFDFPSPPPASHLIAALDELFALGAIGEDGQLTRPLGQNMAELPLPPQLAKMLLVSGVCICVFGIERVGCFSVQMLLCVSFSIQLINTSCLYHLFFLHLSSLSFLQMMNIPCLYNLFWFVTKLLEKAVLFMCIFQVFPLCRLLTPFNHPVILCPYNTRSFLSISVFVSSQVFSLSWPSCFR